MQFDTDIYQNIIKRKEDIVYLSFLSDKAANVGFINSQQLNTNNNLFIADRSTSLAANRIQNVNPTIKVGSNFFTIETDAFLITDEFTDIKTTIVEIPLFYKHIISINNMPRVDVDNNNYTAAANIKLIKVQILDQFFQPIKALESKINLSAGIVYNNLDPTYNESTDYTVYYIKYTINNNGTINTFIELLNNEPLFSLASFEDLDTSLQLINDGRKVYLLDEEDNKFKVTLPTNYTTTDYAFKPLNIARIQVVKPPTKESDTEWFVKISNGKFFSTIGSVLYKYRIAEFLTQVFTPEPPFKLISDEQETVLTSNLIKLDNSNIKEDSGLQLYISITINNSNDDGIAAFTTNTSLVSTVANNGKTYEKWNNISKRGIRSVDYLNGILDIEGLNLKTTYIVRASYYYEETNYEYTSINFNPLSNSDAASHRYTLFIDPETITEEKDQTLFYLKSDESGKVVESNWTLANGGQFDNTTQKYSATDDLYLDVPTVGAPSYIPSSNITRFAQELSTEGSGRFLILGDITTAEGTSVDQLSKVDTRLRGGGIKESAYDTILESQPETVWYWDKSAWDGIPYQGNASYFVEVPASILEGTGGTWSPKEIRDVVEKHTALGVYPIIKAYGPDITITNIEPTSNSITLKWISHGI